MVPGPRLVVLETDATAAGEVPQWIPVLSMAFLLIYCLESGVKIYVLRWKWLGPGFSIGRRGASALLPQNLLPVR